MTLRKVPHSAGNRIGAGLLAVALLPVAWFGLALLLIGGFVSAQLPDPSVPDGDPCCGYPDTWAEVASGLLFSVVLAALLAVVVRAIYGLLRWAARAWTPSVRSWAITAGVGASLATLGFGTLLAFAASAPQPTDCATYDVRPELLRASDASVRRDEARRIDDCQPLSDATKAEVTELFGQPSSKDERSNGFSSGTTPTSTCASSMAPRSTPARLTPAARSRAPFRSRTVRRPCR